LLRSICDSDLSPTQRHVLMAVALRVGWTQRKGRPAGTCHPSVRTLARDTGLCERAVGLALKAAQTARWLKVEPRSVNGMATSNSYRVTPQTKEAPP
jgi:hypothetical protein